MRLLTIFGRHHREVVALIDGRVINQQDHVGDVGHLWNLGLGIVYADVDVTGLCLSDDRITVGYYLEDNSIQPRLGLAPVKGISLQCDMVTRSPLHEFERPITHRLTTELFSAHLALHVLRKHGYIG